LDAGVDQARADLEVAEMQQQLLISPVLPQIGHVIAPLQQAIVVAGARLQKLTTGGNSDQATLDLHIALARAETARLEAALAGSPAGELGAVMGAAQALLTEASLRTTQAANGQGGADARPEDLAIADALALAAKERFLALVDPLREQIEIAKAKLESAEA